MGNSALVIVLILLTSVLTSVGTEKSTLSELKTAFAKSNKVILNPAAASLCYSALPLSFPFTYNNTDEGSLSTTPPDSNVSMLKEAQHLGSSYKGTIKIKKFNSHDGEIIPNFVFRITPNPYTLRDSLIVHDNDKTIDCNSTKGTIQINNAEFSSYRIEEIEQVSGSVLHDIVIAINKETSPTIVVNIITNDLGPQADKWIYLQNNKMPNQFLVMLKDTVSDTPQSFADQIASKVGVKVIHIYKNTIRGVAIRVENEQSLNEILFDSRVKFFEQDQVGHISSSSPLQVTSQIVPTGISRVIENDQVNANADTSHVANTNSKKDKTSKIPENQKNTDVDIAIIDSGVNLVHPDLYVYRNVSFVNGTSSGNDDNGHGTQVAGIAAAKDNSMGIVGTAPGARVWALKVCDKSGDCPVSSQIAAVDYATMYSDQIDVANISIENPDSSAYNNAIGKSVAAGITYTVAAGNSGRDAVSTSPANAPSVIAVSAIADSDGRCGGMGRPTIGGNDDTFANFSNFGPVVDIAAPGVDILSTYKATDYAIDSGTSMAAAHVAGVAGLYKAVHPLASPSEIRNSLIDSGSVPTTKCDGKAHGYFFRDSDTVPESLLYHSQHDVTSSRTAIIHR